MGCKINDNQETLNLYYGNKIISVLSEPILSERMQSDLSYAEVKGILKHTIRQIKKMPIRFKNDGWFQ